ncbi:MAG: penicillin-binding transpeptidase domain-containing protein, partial [Vicinamibacterales bacterium]
PFSTRAHDLTMATMPSFAADDWTVFGKTGTGNVRRADGTLDDDRAFGWFVGWARRGDRTVVFARLLKDDGPNEVAAGLRARSSMLADLPGLLRGR